MYVETIVKNHYYVITHNVCWVNSQPHLITGNLSMSLGIGIIELLAQTRVFGYMITSGKEIVDIVIAIFRKNVLISRLYQAMDKLIQIVVRLLKDKAV